MLQFVGLIVALVGSLLFALPQPFSTAGVSGGGPVGRPHAHPSPTIVLPVSHENPTTSH